MCKIKKTIYVILVTTLSAFINVAKSEELPDGWRSPIASELNGSFMRERSEKKFITAKADFNGDGDGKIDSAYLVKSTIYSGQALLIKLSNDNKYIWLELYKIHWGKAYPEEPISMGISIQPPGQYKTACGKGFWECKDKENPFVKIKYHGLDYFKWGSASSVLYWNEDNGKFEQVWLSD